MVQPSRANRRRGVDKGVTVSSHTNGMLSEPLILGDQGSFFFGGTVTKWRRTATRSIPYAAYVKFQAAARSRLAADGDVARRRPAQQNL